VSHVQLVLSVITTLSAGVLAFAVATKKGAFKDLNNAQKDTDATMSDAPVGSTTTGCPEQCPKCGRQKHDSGKYPRRKSERRKALLRDARDPTSELSQTARKFIGNTDGNNVPPGYEVSHEEPLYTVPKAERCELDVADNLKTQKRATHRARHKRCGQQFHDYPI
jgi:hypothetical protein